MMIKYRVHEVAKDLNVPSKEIVDLLQKHFGDVKKHMTALTEEELDVVFEHYTQLKALPNFDAYFAENKTVAEDQAAQAAAEAAEAELPKPEKAPKAVKADAGKPAARETAPAKPAQRTSGQPAQEPSKRKTAAPGKNCPGGSQSQGAVSRPEAGRERPAETGGKAGHEAAPGRRGGSRWGGL